MESVSLVQWLPYFIAIVSGLIIGIERERSHPKQKTMGVRTFLMISLLGAVAGGLERIWLAFLIAAFSFALIVIGYFTQTNSNDGEVDRGLTTEFAAGLIFCIGFVAHQSPALAAALGPVVAFILFSKRKLHRFTHQIKPVELETALLILLAGVVILNIVPDRTVDPWDVFNPRQFGYIILTLAGLEFVSYWVSKGIGEKRSSLLVGFLGGFVSSTAVLVSAAQKAKRSPENWRTALTSILAAQVSSFLEVFLIVGLVSPPLLWRVSAPVGVCLLVSFCALWIMARQKGHYGGLELKSPLDWRGVFRLSILLGLILAAISVSEKWLGDQAMFTMSFLTGLFELHGTALASATMYTHNLLSIESAVISTLFAVSASFLSKIVMSWMLCGGRFASVLTTIYVLMAIVALALYRLLLP